MNYTLNVLNCLLILFVGDGAHLGRMGYPFIQFGP